MERRFIRELNRINLELIKMGGLCEDGLNILEKILFDKKVDEITNLKSVEKQVDRLENEIETSCQQIILREQPVAQDLHQIYGTMKIIGDLERISDQTLSIGMLSLEVEAILPEFNSLFYKIKKIVSSAIDSYSKLEENLAEKTITRDQQVNEHFDIIKNSLAQSMPTDMESALNQLMIAKYMEGIGDHAKNIGSVALNQMIN